MATQQNCQPVSFDASGDLSAAQFKAVVIDANGRVAVAGAAVAAIGVLQNKPSALGRAAEVVTNHGAIVKVLAGGTVTAAQALETDASGRLVTFSAGYRVAVAKTSGVVNDIIEVIWGAPSLS
jgi:ribosomal protein S9